LARGDLWVFTRNHGRQAGENNDVAALVDVYELMGFEGMRTALRRATSTTARYGEPLPLEVRDLFIEQAPEGVRSQVAAKVARVRF
jgi:hypothetical protein